MPQTKGTRLVRRSNGIYYILKAGDRRGASTRTRDRATAETCLAAFIQEYQRAEPAGELTVKSALADYHEHHVSVRVTDADRQAMIRAHLEAFFGTAPAAGIEPADVAAYVAWRKSGKGGTAKPKRAKDATIRRELGMLVAALNHAAKKTRRLRRDQVPHIDLPPAAPPRGNWLPHEACVRLIQAACGSGVHDRPLPRVYTFIAIALETGARSTAIRKLTREQVDLERGIIDLNPPGAAQTKKRRPKVPISDRLRPILERAMKEHDSPYVIGSSGSIKRAFATTVKRATDILDRLGQHDLARRMENVTPHTLRHTWATLAAQAGVSMFDIAGVLGDTVETVTRNYAHHSPDYLRAAVNFRRDVG